MQRTILVGLCLALLYGVGVVLADITYENPLMPKGDNPDPGAHYYAPTGTYYAATTSNNNPGPKFPIHTSQDLADWSTNSYVFPTEGSWPAWAFRDFWAPEIHIINGRPTVYFAARAVENETLSVGVAIASDITGPYKDPLGMPLVHNTSMGNIDPTYFNDIMGTNKHYLIWKEDGNGAVPQVPTNIYLQELDEEGIRLVGPRISIFVNNASTWEGPLVEGPWVIYNNSYYYLFYSGNGYATPLYAIGVARSRNIDGPYERYENNPIVQSDDYWSGPGHCSVIQVQGYGQSFMIYHSWVINQVSGQYHRHMMMDVIEWTEDGWPTISGGSPSHGRQPVP